MKRLKELVQVINNERAATDRDYGTAFRVQLACATPIFIMFAYAYFINL